MNFCNPVQNTNLVVACKIGEQLFLHFLYDSSKYDLNFELPSKTFASLRI